LRGAAKKSPTSGVDEASLRVADEAETANNGYVMGMAATVASV
jgi:hypothetical protein